MFVVAAKILGGQGPGPGTIDHNNRTVFRECGEKRDASKLKRGEFDKMIDE